MDAAASTTQEDSIMKRVLSLIAVLLIVAALIPTASAGTITFNFRIINCSTPLKASDFRLYKANNMYKTSYDLYASAVFTEPTSTGGYQSYNCSCTFNVGIGFYFVKIGTDATSPESGVAYGNGTELSGATSLTVDATAFISKVNVSFSGSDNTINENHISLYSSSSSNGENPTQSGASFRGYHPNFIAEIPTPSMSKDLYYYVVIKANGEEKGVSEVKPYEPNLAFNFSIDKAAGSDPDDPDDPNNPGGDSDDDSGPTYIDGTISLSDKDAPHINLAKETVKVPFTVAAYSVDGGRKWKKGTLPAADKLSKLFDKGLTLWVASKYNEKDIKKDKMVVEKKGVASSATVVMFPAIEKRPKANTEKLAPYYWTENPDTWVLCKKGSTGYTAPEGTYEWAETNDGKTPKGSWQEMTIPSVEENADHSSDGLKLKQPGEKVSYLFRSVATEKEDVYTPAGKAFKVSPAALNKAPTYKEPSAKKGTAVLKLKKGDFCKVGDKVYGSLTSATTLSIVYEVNDAETEIPGGSKVTIWKAATGSKPRSVEQKGLTMPKIPKPET